MTLHDYALWVVGYAGYMLGLMHGKGREHWSNVPTAIAIGVFWPVAVAYGIYATHFKAPERKDND